MIRMRLFQLGVLIAVLFAVLGGTAIFHVMAQSSQHSLAHSMSATKTQAKSSRAPAATRGKHGPWSLVFSDSFNGTQLSSQWITYSGVYSIGDNAWDPSEVTVSNGQVHIRMEKRTLNGKPYTAGGMGAMGLAMTYGKFEFRARLAKGQGVGPYAILWPQVSGHGDVEVDLFESPPPNKSKIYFTNHGNGSPSQIISTSNFGDAFHTFTYEWTPGKLDLQIDGVEQGSMTKNVPNFPMWFGLAIGSGDAFIGAPNSSTVLPVSFDIQYVHIYKYTG